MFITYNSNVLLNFSFVVSEHHTETTLCCIRTHFLTQHMVVFVSCHAVSYQLKRCLGFGNSFDINSMEE